MKVVLSTWGRFHVFHLARQLERFGWLECVFVTYPRFMLSNEGISPQKLKSNPWFHLPLLLKWRLGLKNPRLDRAWSRLVDKSQLKFIARHIPPCDVFIALSGSGLSAGPIVQNRGGKWICNRSAPHQVYSDNLMAEEFARYGIAYSPTDPWMVQKELEEYAKCDIIVVPSDFARQSFIEMGMNPGRIVKIPFGGDLKNFRRTRPRNPDVFEILYCGQVSFRKGIPYLIDAFRRLRHPKKKLTIAGSVLPEIKPFLASANLDGVEFVGIVHRSKLPDYYSRANVFAIASLAEGMAKVQTEAMACGTPVVATFNSGATDVIRDGVDGLIVPARSSELFAERLQELADDPQRQEHMGANALARIQSLGGWDQFGNAYRKLCLRLTGAASLHEVAT